MKHVMVDIEPLGVRPGCKILSLGAVVFSPAGLGAEFYREVVVDKGQEHLHTDPQTLAWWQEQAPEVRDRLFNDDGTKPTLRAALGAFNLWLSEGAEFKHTTPQVCVWGNGAAFDNAILELAFDLVTLERPGWAFYNDRCYRTLKNLFPGVPFERQGLLHNALDDAKTQAAHAVAIMNKHELWGSHGGSHD